ncbi:CAP domain-containing protein [Mycobacterium sp. NPDC003449]
MAVVALALAAIAAAALAAPAASADNRKYNVNVIEAVGTVRVQAGCTEHLRVNPQLRLAAQWQAVDVLNNTDLNGDIGSDGSTPSVRAANAGYRGRVSETVAVNPALAMSGMELINRWFGDPEALAVMRDCSMTQIGVWSENRLDRTVVVAVYGVPA